MSNIDTHLSIIDIDDRRNEVPLISSLSMIKANSGVYQLNQVDLHLTFVMDRKKLNLICL